MSRHIPSDVKRELRQESYFGFAYCGIPVIDYHHIIPYSKKEHNNSEDMIAFCPNHHRVADDGAIESSRLDFFSPISSTNSSQRLALNSSLRCGVLSLPSSNILLSSLDCFTQLRRGLIPSPQKVFTAMINRRYAIHDLIRANSNELSVNVYQRR